MKSKIVALKKNEDFKSLLKGHKISNKYFVMFYKKLLKKNSNKLNISIVTKKKLGNATKRNLCKRQFKNLLHQIVKELTLNFNYGYLILVKDNALKQDCFLDLKKTMFTEFKKII